MTKQTIAVVLGAAVLFFVAIVGAMAFTSNDSSGGNLHTMPNGQMMTGMMGNGMMGNGMMGNSSGHTMSGGQTMTGPMHTMSGGEQMPGMTHP